MASFQKHTSKTGISTCRVQIFLNGIRDSKSGFESKQSAKQWATTREAEILLRAGNAKVHSAESDLVAVLNQIKTPVKKSEAKTLGDGYKAENKRLEYSSSNLSQRFRSPSLVLSIWLHGVTSG